MRTQVTNVEAVEMARRLALEEGLLVSYKLVSPISNVLQNFGYLILICFCQTDSSIYFSVLHIN